MIKYKIYPTLLDEFSRYLNHKISLENMLNRINRIRDFDENTLLRMKKGVAFETAVMNNTFSDFDPEIIKGVQRLLPLKFAKQYPVKFIYKEALIYGFVDIAGEKRIIDLKTTANYNRDKYLYGFQNLYLLGLKEYGFTQMEYIVYDFEKLHHISLEYSDIDFEKYFAVIDVFINFLETHREKITDPKIFVQNLGNSLFD